MLEKGYYMDYYVDWSEKIEWRRSFFLGWKVSAQG